MTPVATSGGRQADSPIPLSIDTSGPTVRERLAEWEISKRISDVTRGHIDDCVGGVRAAAAEMNWVWPGQITTSSIVDYLAVRKAGGASPKYRNDMRAYLLAFCAFLGMNPNPCDAVPRAQVNKRRVRYVPTVPEVVRLIIAASIDWRKKDRWLVYLTAALTGLRMRTLKLLRPEHLHLERMSEGLAWIDVPADLVKNGEETHIWLTRECAERLLAHVRAAATARGYLFACVPKLEAFNRDLAVAGLSKRASPGAPTFARHSLRHFHATHLKSLDRFTDEERADAMGHKTTAMTVNVYTMGTHEMIGHKIWKAQPLLPPEFGGNRGRRKGKKGDSCLTGGGKIADDGAATSFRHTGRASEPPSRSSPEQPHPGRKPTGLVAVSGVPPGGWGYSRDERDPDDPEPPGSPRLTSNGVGGSNPPTPIEGQTAPDLTGAVWELVRAQEGLIAAQGRVIRVLREKAPDGISDCLTPVRPERPSP